MVGFAKDVGVGRGTTDEAACNAAELEAAVEAYDPVSFQGDTLLPFRANRTSRDDMTLFLAVVTKLLVTIPSNMAKRFTTKALNSTHVSTHMSPLCCISRRNRCTNSSPMFYGSLSNDTLLLTKKLTQTSIQRWDRMTVHRIRTCNFKVGS